jgi:hypothetical protein
MESITIGIAQMHADGGRRVPNVRKQELRDCQTWGLCWTSFTARATFWLITYALHPGWWMMIDPHRRLLLAFCITAHHPNETAHRHSVIRLFLTHLILRMTGSCVAQVWLRLLERTRLRRPRRSSLDLPRYRESNLLGGCIISMQTTTHDHMSLSLEGRNRVG